MSKEAMTLALELFEQFGRDSRLKYEHQAIYKTIVALKEALAKQEQGEPEAWMHPDGRIWTFGRGFDKSTFTIPLYTTPQPAQKPWVGLTDEEINDLVHSHDDFAGLWEFADSVEAKLKGKNT